MNPNELAQHWTDRANELEDLAYQGQPMPNGISYPEQLLFLRFRYLYAYARISQMPQEQGKAEKQEIIMDYLAHCLEHLLYQQTASEWVENQKLSSANAANIRSGGGA